LLASGGRCCYTDGKRTPCAYCGKYLMIALQWIVAAVTAMFVAVVAFLQWRTAQQKAVLDLFDRRHAIYEIVRNAVNTIASNSTAFDQSREKEFTQVMERAYFFFGDDVDKYLEQLWSAIVDVRDADQELKDITDPAGRAALIDKRRKAMDRVAQFPHTGKPLFAKYMRFKQKMPHDWADC
jgi:NMD protein affecting ribosome stability and mRNA decay